MEDRVPFALLVILGIGATGSALVLAPGSEAAFRPYFGDANPVLVTATIAVAGVVAMALLHSRGWFRVRPPAGSPAGLSRAAGLASVLALVVILADWQGAFPQAINVALPSALLFYPLMGYVVEIVFHVVPLALLLSLFRSSAQGDAGQRARWICVGLVALIEPVFQVYWTPPDPSWVRLLLGPHLVLFNLIGLWLFKRHGFLTMCWFRLVYYLHWHILWGYARLQLLF